jgi:hypothetical protein
VEVPFPPANHLYPSTMQTQVPSLSDLIDRKKQKRLLTEGTDLFNQSPSKGLLL